MTRLKGTNSTTEANVLRKSSGGLITDVAEVGGRGHAISRLTVCVK